MHLKSHLAIFALTSMALCGCTASPWATAKKTSPAAAAGNSIASSTASPKTDAPGAESAGVQAASSTSNSAQQQMAEVLNELRQVGGLEPADYDQLIRDMQKTDPNLWPLLVQQMRATVAYRERLLAKAGPSQPSGALARHPLANDPVSGGRGANQSALPHPAENPLPTSVGESAVIAAGSAGWPANAPQHGPQRLPPVEPSPAETMAGRLRLPAAAGGDSDRRLYENMPDAEVSRPAANGAEHEARKPAPPDMRRAERNRDAMVRPVAHVEEVSSTKPDAPQGAAPVERELPSTRLRASAPNEKPQSRADGPPDELDGAESASVGPKDRSSEAKPAEKQADAAKRADWRESLAAAIRDLERQTASPQGTAADAAQLARLRLLYLAAGQRDAALRPAPSLPASQQEFLSKSLYGWDAWLDAERTPDAALRAAEAKRALEEAAERLADAAPLAVRNLAFCTEILSYGSHKPFRTNEFSPDQEVLLYVEVENFSSESTARGYHTALRSSYQIFDARGQRVAEHDFTLTEEYCQNQRRDFFIGYHLRIPKRIYPGKYTLQLTVEDTKSRKVGQSQIEFTVKDAPAAAK